MRRAITTGTRRLEFLLPAERRADDSPRTFRDAAEARQFLLGLAREPAARATLRRALADTPGANTAGATDEQVLTWLADRLARRQVLVMDSGVVRDTSAGAGAAAEQPQQQADTEPARQRAFDLQLVSVTPHFAPGETIYIDGDPRRASGGESCTIQYRVIDPGGSATRGTLEILRKEGGTLLHRVDLTSSQYNHGSHTIEWNGRCNRGPTTYPFVHLLHSPYTVRVTVNGLSEKKVSGQTAVLLDGLVIQRGGYTLDGVAPAEGSDKHYQYTLAQLGFHPGAVDGDIGSMSQRAIRNFQRSTGYLQVNGRLDDYTKAALDHTAPAGTGTDHYQFILNYLGFRCGHPVGSINDATRLAVRRYKTVRGISPIDETLDAATKTRLDAETLGAIPKRAILEGDEAHTDVADNPYPAAGAQKKVWVDCDSCWSPDGMPSGKWQRERDNLIRPNFPLIARPLVRRKAGGKAHAPQATGAVRIEFTVATTAPPADLGVQHTTARAFVQRVMNLDGSTSSTGHHLHRNRGGIRSSSDPGCFRAGRSLEPYNVSRSGNKHRCNCELYWHDRQGTAGVFFRPSTIGGDRFSVVARVSSSGFDTPPASEVSQQTGTFIIWRRYRLSKRWFMGYVSLPHAVQRARMGMQPYYDPCFLEFVDIKPPSPTMLVHNTPANQQTRTAGDEIVDKELYRHLLRQAGYRASVLPDSQINTRYDDQRLYPLTPAAAWPQNWSNYQTQINNEIVRFETRLMGTLRELSALEAPEGVVLLLIAHNAPYANTHQIPPGHNAPSSAVWIWSIFATERGVILKQSGDDFEGAAPVAQTAALAREETLEFADHGDFAGIPLANRRITFAAGTTQDQVIEQINSHEVICEHVSAGKRDGTVAGRQWLELEHMGNFEVKSDRAAAADSSGIGTTAVTNEFRHATAGTPQTQPLATAEVLEFSGWGAFGGVTNVAHRRVTLAAGSTQAQVAAAINSHPTVGIRMLAQMHEDKLVLSALGHYRLTSDVAAAATSTGLGSVPLGEGGQGETVAHEVGHALWLRHATTKTGRKADYPREHNRPEWQICNMSYINQDHFCGKCVLKLRGANETTLLNL